MLEEEVFELWFIPNIISLERIFEKIKASGEERDLKYESFAVTNEVKK